MKRLPGVGSAMRKEFGKIEAEINKSTDALRAHKVPKLPPKGMKASTIKDKVNEALKREKENLRDHKVHGTWYIYDKKDVEFLAKDISKEFLYHNPLHYELYPTTTQLEAEIISMTVDLYNGGKDGCGITTSGGTESILLAMLSYRKWALDVKGITEPEVVAPLTAHVAFEKACHYFNIKYVTVPFDEKTGLPSFSKIKAAVNANTIAVVASCPSYPYGVFDEVEKYSKLAKSYGIGLHVDCCLGGFINPFCKNFGVEIPTFDFTLSGVTSISIDSHKFGQSPKGCSILLFKNKQLRKYAIFATAKWPGGIYAGSTMAGSRAAAPIAGAWAAMMYYGYDGYVSQAKIVVEAAQKLAAGIRQRIPMLHVVGSLHTSVVSFQSKSKTLDIYVVYDKLAKRGWKLGALIKPAGMHLSITPFNAGTIDDFLDALEKAVQDALAMPKTKKKAGTAAIYGTAKTLPARFVEDGAVIAIESILNLHP